MILSVDEAKQKYCPFTFSNPALHNGSFDPNPAIADAWTRCMATVCMAWRETGMRNQKVAEGYCGMMPNPILTED